MLPVALLTAVVLAMASVTAAVLAAPGTGMVPGTVVAVLVPAAGKALSRP